jgi:hypothetical protein
MLHKITTQGALSWDEKGTIMNAFSISIGKSVALAAMIGALSIGVDARAATIFSEDFDSGTAAGFTFSGSGLWHVTSNFPASSHFALGYVQGETPNSSTPNGNYNTGGANSGFAFSPVIALPLTGVSKLKLKAVNFNEIDDSPDFFDRLQIGISLNGSSFNQILASTSTFDASPNYFAPVAIGGNYTGLTIDLSAYSGQNIRLAFRYLTLDGIDNNHPGARIDSLKIENELQNVVPEPASWALMVSGFAFTGAAIRRRRRVRVTYA